MMVLERHNRTKVQEHKLVLGSRLVQEHKQVLALGSKLVQEHKQVLALGNR